MVKASSHPLRRKGIFCAVDFNNDTFRHCDETSDTPFAPFPAEELSAPQADVKTVEAVTQPVTELVEDVVVPTLADLVEVVNPYLPQ